MNNDQKHALASKVVEWLAQGPDFSQAVLAQKTGMSQTNISHVASGRWVSTTISDAQWMKLQSFFRVEGHLDTWNFREITGACEAAQYDSRIVGVDGDTGLGKSYALDAYAKTNARTYLLRCRSSMGVRQFCAELGKVVGVSRPSATVYEVENQIIAKLSTMDRPLIIIDEAEYLKPAALNCLKTLMQELKDRCGFVIAGIIKQWIERMAARQNAGMPQFLRRIEHSWVICQPVAAADVRSAAAQMGITDKQVIERLMKDATNYDRLQTYVRDLATTGQPVTTHLYSQLFGNDSRTR